MTVADKELGLTPIASTEGRLELSIPTTVVLDSAIGIGLPAVDPSIRVDPALVTLRLRKQRTRGPCRRLIAPLKQAKDHLLTDRGATQA